MRLERVTATGSTGYAGSGVGDTVVIPGNDADCVIAASGGAGNSVELAVRHSMALSSMRLRNHHTTRR